MCAHASGRLANCVNARKFYDMLESHSIKSKHGARRVKKNLGRGGGSGWGTTAGRGTKGQRARSGSRKGLKLFGVRSIVLSTPKLRGFKSGKLKAVTINLAQLQRKFDDGTIVTAAKLADAGFIKSTAESVKIVGSKIEKKITIQKLPISAGASAAILKAGGAVVV